MCDSEHEDNDATLVRMVNILDYAQGFTLLFARCNFPALRRELAQKAETALALRNIRVHHVNLTERVSNIRHLLRDELLAAIAEVESPTDITPDRTEERPPLPTLHELAATYRTGTDGDEPKLVIFLTGLELSIPYNDPNAPALAQLNLGRDFFPRELPHPLLIWLPDFALTAIARHAPDFWSWRSGLFEFAGTEIERTDALSRHTRNEWNWTEVSNLRAEEKLVRRSLLESLLDDYLQQPPSARRDRELADLYFSLGQIYHLLGDLPQALNYYEQALTLQLKIGDRAGEEMTLNNIAVTALDLDDYATALYYLELALVISQEIGDRSGEGRSLNNISQIYDALGDYTTALHYLQQALVINQEINNHVGVAWSLNNISRIFKARGDYATALDYLEQALVIQQKIGDKSGLCATLFNIGHIHWQNGEQEEALKAWVTVYQLAYRSNLAQVLQALTGLAEQLGLDGGLDGWAMLAEQMEEGQ